MGVKVDIKFQSYRSREQDAVNDVHDVEAVVKNVVDASHRRDAVGDEQLASTVGVVNHESALDRRIA